MQQQPHKNQENLNGLIKDEPSKSDGSCTFRECVRKTRERSPVLQGNLSKSSWCWENGSWHFAGMERYLKMNSNVIAHASKMFVVFTFCTLILQVGTSTLMEHFLTLSDLPEANKKRLHLHNYLLHENLPKYLKIKNTKLNNRSVGKYLGGLNYLKFSFVRHPFERQGK